MGTEFRNELGASKRALSASDGGPAWAMMSKVKKLPQYDAEKEPSGVINLSGAENDLMKDWLDDFVRSNDGKIAIEDGEHDFNQEGFWLAMTINICSRAIIRCNVWK